MMDCSVKAPLKPCNGSLRKLGGSLLPDLYVLSICAYQVLHGQRSQNWIRDPPIPVKS